MRVIYTDEAGTGPAEQVRVVASVIVHGDTQWNFVHQELERRFDINVPEKYRRGFIFHGKEVFNGGKTFDRNEWPFSERLKFFKEFVSLPLLYGLPIAVGVVHNTSGVDRGFERLRQSVGNRVKQHQFEHLLAFTACMERSDRFLSKYLNGSENGFVVSEDVPETRKFLAEIGLTYRSDPLFMPSEYISRDKRFDGDDSEPEGMELKIRHIIDVPHFVSKGKAPFLQLADACAFAFRRYLSRQKFGEELIVAMLGSYDGQRFLNDDRWFKNGPSGLFNTFTYWPEKERQELLNMQLTAAITHLPKGN